MPCHNAAMRSRLWILPLVLVATAMTSQADDIGIRIDSVTPKPGALSVAVQVLDNGSGQTVDDADVEVTYRAEDGTESKGQALEADADGGGLYRGDVMFPAGGEYTIHISANGQGNLELVQTVPDPPAKSATRPAGSTSDEDGKDDDSSTGIVIGIAAAAVVVVLVAGVLIARRRRRTDEPSPTRKVTADTTTAVGDAAEEPGPPVD